MNKKPNNRNTKQNHDAIREAAQATDEAISELIALAVYLVEEEDQTGDLYASCVAELERALEQVKQAAARYRVVRGGGRHEH